MLFHLHQRERRGDHRPLPGAVQDLAGLSVRQLRRQPFAQQRHAAVLQAQRNPPRSVVISGVRRIPELLSEGSAALDVAAIRAGFLRPVPDPFAERLDGRAIDAPLGDAELPQVRPRVAGQSLAVLEVEAAELAARFGGWGSGGQAVSEGLRCAPSPPPPPLGGNPPPPGVWRAVVSSEVVPGRRSRLQDGGSISKWDGGRWTVPKSLLLIRDITAKRRSPISKRGATWMVGLRPTQHHG